MKLQKKVQRIICNTTLASCAIAFFLALGLATDIYNLMPAVDWNIKGVELFEDIQPFNSQLVMTSIIMIVLAISLFVTRTHLRRRYYISNHIAIWVAGLFNIAASVWAILNILKFKKQFLTEVDFKAWLEMRQLISDFPYTESTLWLDLNIASRLVLIFVSLLLFVNLIWKIMLMKYEDRLLSGTNQPEKPV